MSGVIRMECNINGNLLLFVHCQQPELAEPFVSMARDMGFAAQSGMPEPGGGARALLLDAALLPDLAPEQLPALHNNGTRVFLLMQGYDAAAIRGVRDVVDYLFFLPLLPEAVIRRIRLFLEERKTEAPTLTLHREWIRMQACACLKALAVPTHLLGHRYMCAAVELMLESGSPMHLSMMRDIYPHVAQLENTSPVMVDRAMKHAVEVAWRKGNVLMQQAYFGYSSVDKKGMPTNAEWLHAVTDRTRLLLCDRRGKDRFTEQLMRIDHASGCGLSVDVDDGTW